MSNGPTSFDSLLNLAINIAQNNPKMSAGEIRTALLSPALVGMVDAAVKDTKWTGKGPNGKAWNNGSKREHIATWAGQYAYAVNNGNQTPAFPGGSLPQNNNSGKSGKSGKNKGGQSSTPNPTGGTSNSGGSSNGQSSQSSSTGGGSMPPPTGGTSNSNSGGGSTPPPNGGATPPPPPPNPPSRSEIMRAASVNFARRAMAARKRLNYKLNAGPGQDATEEAEAYRAALDEFGKVYLRGREEEYGLPIGSQHFADEATRISNMERLANNPAFQDKLPGVDFNNLTADDIIAGLTKPPKGREPNTPTEDEINERQNAPLRQHFPKVDERGYAPLDIRKLRRAMHRPTKFAMSYTASKNRNRFRRFAEELLKVRRFGSDEYVAQMWKQLTGKRLSSFWTADMREVRGAMGLDNIDSAIQEYASVGYNAQDLIDMPKSERMAMRANLEGLGKVSPLSQSGNIGMWERLNPWSKTSDRKRKLKNDIASADALLSMLRKKAEDPNATKEEKAKAQLGIEKETAIRNNALNELNSLRKGIDPKGQSSEEKKDDEVVRKAKEVVDTINKTIDFKSGTFKKDVPIDEKTSKLFSKRNASFEEKAAILYNDGESEAERNRKISLANGGTGFRFIDNALARGQRWRQRGQSLGLGLGKIAGIGLGRAAGASIGGMASGALGAAFGPIGIAVGLLTGIYATCKGIYAAAQKSIQRTFELAPFNGRLGATKAQYEGHEFQRKVKFAGDTEEERAQLVAAQDDLLNNTMELRAAFAKIGIYLQTVFLKILGRVGKTLNTFTKALQGNFWKNLGRGLWGGVKRTATNLLSGNASLTDYLLPFKALYKGFRDEMEEIAEENERKEQEERENNKEVKQKQEELNNVRYKQSSTQNEYAAEGDLARKYFETGKVDKLLALQAGYANPEDAKKALDNESMRAEWEDAIAANDIKRGTDFFQGYKGIEGGAPASASQIAERILNVLENSNAISLKELETQEKELKAAIETAQNTRKEAQPVKDQPIFRAMEKMAQLYAPKGGEKLASETQYSGSFGASQEKQYGRFAGESQTTWGRKSR